MTKAVQTLPAFRARVQAQPTVATNGSTPAWLESLRQAGAQRFAAIGFPSPRDEDWKYTNPEPILKTPFEPAAAAPRVTARDIARHRLEEHEGVLLVLANGHLVPELSHIPPLPRGIRVGGLAERVKTQPESLKGLLGTACQPSEATGFAALNTAWLQDGAVVDLDDGAVLNQPIHILLLNAPGSKPLASGPRLIVRLGEHARATIVESHHTLGGGTHLVNAVTEILLGPGSALEHTTLSDEATDAYRVASTHVKAARDAEYRHFNACLGAGLARNDIRVALDGEGSRCRLDGLFMVGGKQHVDNHTWIDHRKPHTTSKELYKGVLDGQSRGVFHGKVDIRKDAQKSDADQHNPNLILSRGALVDSTPALEINADDVKAAHGSTIGQLDRDAVFYLRSRGIDPDTARSLLAFGFAKEAIDRVSSESVRRRITDLVLGRLPGGRTVRETLHGLAA